MAVVGEWIDEAFGGGEVFFGTQRKARGLERHTIYQLRHEQFAIPPSEGDESAIFKQSSGSISSTRVP